MNIFSLHTTLLLICISFHLMIDLYFRSSDDVQNFSLFYLKRKMHQPFSNSAQKFCFIHFMQNIDGSITSFYSKKLFF